MTILDRWYGRLMRRWAEGPRCRNPECRKPYPTGRGVSGSYCSEACAGRHQELNAW